MKRTNAVAVIIHAVLPVSRVAVSASSSTATGWASVTFSMLFVSFSVLFESWANPEKTKVRNSIIGKQSFGLGILFISLSPG
jgi:hypothetical protein